MATSHLQAWLPLRLITHNVRFATTTPSPNERPWAERRPRLCAQLRFLTAGRDSSFLCLQEVLHAQLQDVAESLGGLWAHAGLGRDDGWTGGEHSPIFYRQLTWWCERSQTYWLSETPEVPSRGWDADLPRVVTVGRFRHKETGAKVIVMSTHLDHRGTVARRESARLLLRIAERWAVGDEALGVTTAPTAARAAPPLPVILGGDFNSTPDGVAYREITAPAQGGPAGMVDVSTLIPAEERYGNGEITYTSFGEPHETPGRIDFLFARRDERPAGEAVRFATFGVLSNRFDDGVYLSDHRAVVADLEIPVPSGVGG